MPTVKKADCESCANQDICKHAETVEKLHGKTVKLGFEDAPLELVQEYQRSPLSVELVCERYSYKPAITPREINFAMSEGNVPFPHLSSLLHKEQPSDE